MTTCTRLGLPNPFKGLKMKEGLRDERKAQKVVNLQICLFENMAILNLLHPNAFWCILLRKKENIPKHGR
jgi:hypothetical protein